MFPPPGGRTGADKMTDRSVFVNHCPGGPGRLCFSMPKIAASTAALRRANILDAARHCFAAHGIHVSVDEICERAGISKGAFYVYFDSKDAAIQALAEDHNRVVHGFAEVGGLEELARKVAELTTARSTTSSRLELETWTHALKMPALRNALWRNIDEMRRSLEKGVDNSAARAGGRATGTSNQATAEILTIFALGLIAWSALGADRGAKSGESALGELLAVLLGNRYQPAPRKGRPKRRPRRPAAPARARS
jgi:AcrR family transcriptional regulator